MKGIKHRQSLPIFISWLTPFFPLLSKESLGKQAQKLFLQFLVKEMGGEEFEPSKSNDLKNRPEENILGTDEG